MKVVDKLALLEDRVRALTPLLVAYSGGVDSSVLLAVAVRRLGDQVMGVIADSPSLPRESLQQALEQATAFGATVEVLPTGEFENPDYASNPPNRCYYCKAELFEHMDRLAAQRGFAALAYGENADDPPASRPGSTAAREFSVVSPLRDAGLGKADVRELARYLGLPSAEKPAQPCLSSRIPHGTPVTKEAVALIEHGEAVLRNLGFRILRVRMVSMEPTAALVQVAPEELEKLWACKDQAIDALRSAGFSAVTLDPAGYHGAGTL